MSGTQCACVLSRKECIMGSYSFHYIANKKIRKSKELDLPEDVAALDYALMLSRESEIVVWEGERFVARIKKNGAPIGDLEQG